MLDPLEPPDPPIDIVDVGNFSQDVCRQLSAIDTMDLVIVFTVSLNPAKVVILECDP